jgi:TolA-binding protein
MRIRFLFILLTLAGAVPAAAQPQQQNLDRRVGRLEQEMRAVQRRVFPGGAGATVDPELQPTTPGTVRPTGPTADAVSVLTSRIEALEAQLARVTGQVEENGYRLSQLEQQVQQLRSDLQGRVTRLEEAARAAQAAATLAPATPEPATPEPVAEPEPSTTPAQPEAQPIDPVQAAYNAGYRLWEQRRYAEAVTALNRVADRNPRSRWASWARNLAGRAYLDDNQPARAAQTFLQNYQDNPRGDRAADSLFFLGEALVKLERRAEACPVYDELEANYPQMRAYLRERLPAARRAARCS